MTLALLEHQPALELQENMGRTALILAAQFGDNGITGLLLGAGADPDAQDGSGNTAAIYAVGAHNRQPRDALLAAGADLELGGFEGQTAPHTAAATGDDWAAQRLLEAGADPDARSRLGETPLFAAAERGYVDVAALLLAKGAERDAVRQPPAEAVTPGDGGVLHVSVAQDEEADMTGWTALMRAAWEGRAEFVKSLLASGADATIRSPAGDTALALARRRERTEVVALLEASGAR